MQSGIYLESLLPGEEGRRDGTQEEKVNSMHCWRAKGCRQLRLLIIAPDMAHNSISKQITRTAV